MDGNDVRQESWTVGLLNRERLILKVMVKPPKVWMTHLRLLKALTDDNININYENNFKRALITLKKPQQQGNKLLTNYTYAQIYYHYCNASH